MSIVHTLLLAASLLAAPAAQAGFLDFLNPDPMAGIPTSIEQFLADGQREQQKLQRRLFAQGPTYFKMWGGQCRVFSAKGQLIPGLRAVSIEKCGYIVKMPTWDTTKAPKSKPVPARKPANKKAVQVKPGTAPAPYNGRPGVAPKVERESDATGPATL